MDGSSPRTSDVTLAADPTTFPFTSELSLKPLIDFLTEASAHDRSATGTLARILYEELKRAPGFLDSVEDTSAITEHPQILELLMATVFPPVFVEQEYGAALVPFRLRSFYATPPARRMLMSADGSLQGRVNVDEAVVTTIRLLYAYELILRRIYDVELAVEYPLVFTVKDPDTGLERHFRMHFDYRFLNVEPVGPVPPLTPAARERLQANLTDPQVLMELIPPASFVFRGFTIFKAIDITDQEVLSSIKRDLIDKESIVSTTRFEALQAKLQTFFRRPSLRLSLAALQGDQVLMLNSGARLEHACLFADSAHHTVAEFAGSIYERAVRQGTPLIIDDLTSYPGRTCIEDEIIRSGVRNIVVAPLRYQDQVIGTLELDSPRPGELNATHGPKLEEVLPLFSMAVQRSVDELNTRIQAFIKEKFTPIHPAVEWRFRKAVLDSLERHAGGGLTGPGEMEPIVFGDVYPLYGLSDIRGSSTQRALAIQADLIAQLQLAREVLQDAHRARPLPILDQLAYRVERYVADVQLSLKSGDELALVTFLRSEVEPLFTQLADFGPAARARIDAYRAALDPRHGTIYRQRKLFEESVTALNEAVSSYLDLEEQTAQAMFPHYFEKQQTDGVDYQIYVGGSLVEHGRFDPLYLRNLRLWQLMITCGIATRTHRLKDRLSLPLETTHLVLVQSAPLSIRFRFDEKRFDVDGAYNIRYEIVKKRIDKGLVRGTSERITQPGKIAIIYSQPSEVAEYRDYVAYLQHLRYLTREVEDLEIDELQGVQGLRALRVSVDLENPRAERPVAPGDLQAARGPSRE